MERSEKYCGGDMEKMARHQVVFVWMNNDESSHPTRVKKGNGGKTIPPLNDAETKDADDFGSLCASLPWHTVIGPCTARTWHNSPNFDLVSNLLVNQMG